MQSKKFPGVFIIVFCFLFLFIGPLIVYANDTEILSSLGDRVWKDLNGNGIQDCVDTNANGIIGDAGDTGAECQTAGISGVTVNLEDCETNRTVDAGILCQECNITIDKKCLVVPPAPGPFDCDGKVDALTMIWNGPGELTSVNALPGDSDSFPQVTINEEAGVQVVTVTGYQPSANDVTWQWVSTEDSGESKFHLSCSDSEMDGPEDCGMPQGNGKDNQAAYDNVWLLDGLVTDTGSVLDCTPQPLEFTDACTFEASPPPDCETVGKPYSLTFKYTGAGCMASDNDQAADKFECSGDPGDDPVSITIVKDPNNFYVTPESSINEGNLVTLTAYGADMGTEVKLYVGGQFLKFHTSCSQPLAGGDVFGSLELVKFNGKGSGAEVTYFYEVTNVGDISVDITSVHDDKLGELLDTSPVPLTPGGSLTLEKTVYIEETTTNKVTVNSLPCPTDQVTVTVTKDILNFFYQSVEDGTIEGYGPGNSGNNRLNALGNMLAMAGELINIGDIEGACGQLKAALKKCDGDSPPPDFVTGDAVPQLAEMIEELMEDLGCE